MIHANVVCWLFYHLQISALWGLSHKHSMACIIFSLLTFSAARQRVEDVCPWGKSTFRLLIPLCLLVWSEPSSAFILGQVSQSIEPIWSNAYVKDVAKLKVTIKNPVLQKLLASIKKDNKATWDSIKKHDGSVQHLEFLTEEQKDVFRTFAEINQSTIINQAAIRQDFIDQSQSLNLMISPDMPTKDVNKLLIDAWQLGVKTLYYQHSMNSAQAFARKKLNLNDLVCTSCEA